MASGVALIPMVMLDRGVVVWPESKTDPDSQSFLRQAAKVLVIFTTPVEVH